ncbi:hypothetical protein UF70_0214 [Staphylococcus pasteuri]|nr:hypothetical protein UF70_0214 [Staphylococcus pasteuri]
MFNGSLLLSLLIGWLADLKDVPLFWFFIALCLLFLLGSVLFAGIPLVTN